MNEFPDLSEYPIDDDAAYEWFLSDHPWAVAERTRRVAAHHERELERAATVRAWADRTLAADAAGDLNNRPPGWRENLTRLAELMEPMADDTQLNTVLEDAEPDDVRVQRRRRHLEMNRHLAGDENYVYPVHLVGPSAATYPPPGWTPPENRAQAADTRKGEMALNPEKSGLAAESLETLQERLAVAKAQHEVQRQAWDLDPENGNHELQQAKEAINAVQNQEVVWGPWPRDYDAILAAISTARRHLRNAERMARAQKRAARATPSTPSTPPVQDET